MWNGTSGALMANATKKPRNSQICVDSGTLAAMRCRSTQVKVPAPSCSPETMKMPMIEASMIRPPNSE